MRQHYRLEGLSCANCAAKFEKNIRELPEVKEVQLNFGASKLMVDGAASVEDLERAGAFDGIKVRQENEKAPTRIPFWKTGEAKSMFASLPFLIGGWLLLLQYGEEFPAAIGLFALSIVIGGHRLLRTGLVNLFKWEFDMKTLMTIAIIGAAIIGEWGEGAVVVFLFAISEVLERYSMDRARNSIRSLMEIAPQQATIIRNGLEEVTAVEDTKIGEVMLIRPGQKIPLDGKVKSGSSFVNQAAITGESVSVLKSAGDEVFAGTLNEEGAMEVEITKWAEDTTLAKIIHLVEEAQAEKAPSQAFIDRFAKYYTPAIMVIALLVAVIPPLLFGAVWTEWIYSGLAVLVVGCPCALVISTPVAIVTAIGHAAKKGVLIKGGVHLENAGNIRTVAFDKTGTLTEGKPAVTAVDSFSEMDENEILAYAAAIERYSQHPLAKAIVQKAKDLPAVYAENFQSKTGRGVQAVIDGELYWVGRVEAAQELADEVEQKMDSLRSQGQTIMLFGRGDEILGSIAAADTIREESKSIVQRLYEAGVKNTVMLTGDHRMSAAGIAQKLGITQVEAELLPEDKLQKIKELQNGKGKIAMVGDGINDAPALAIADVGIAMGGAGTDTALETADIAFMADDLHQLPSTIRLSRKTLKIIKQNVVFALGLKVLALLLIIPGWLTLWLAIFADMGATLLVVLNSLRLMKWK
ncbi:heavy metal translocating P-type ATPase [Jeotgalibacillus proteolyticus]|uniref:Cd(2+)-exporting ATPase n=1 Tax=Jeotgalibacillus proteolyticus TaxID=2082395 RepID=A0A2S5GCA6_9BACL|nr:heavy metal translocating P-type ATPase [Jeotgalibacillus proteolyticus]PPA70640.1 heavy metal translocating P-type ATPase [Jeotgalibacillus proteolyticus]